MAQFIDKAAVIMEIKKIEKLSKAKADKAVDMYWQIHFDGWVTACKSLLSFLDTLEVKEVDFEKELDKFYGIYRKDEKTYDIKDNEECVDWKIDCNPDFEIAFARHFFELGLKAKGE